jgi:alanine-glyoxylate transaminase/serine-glyoxylate transaminase/serine-pyruvate transaminase
MQPKTKTQQNISAFTPPDRILMGPGPSDMHPRVYEALSKHIIGHLDPEFIRMMDETKALAQYAFQTENKLTMIVSGPGSAGMETCFVNLVEPGDKVIVCRNGVFGGRMKENVERCGATPVMVEDNWGQPVDPNKVEAALKEHPDAKAIAFVHAETSTGVRSDAETICRLAREHDCLSIVDAVTSLGGIPVLVDEWEVDAIYSGSQKCLSCTPGLSPVSFSDRAVERIRGRKTRVQSWFLDLTLVMQYWGDGGAKRSYHHTAPINALYAMHEALRLLQEEGLEARWQRHRHTHEQLRDDLEAMGFTYLVDETYRLPQLNAVFLPEGLEEAPLRRRLLEEYNIEVGGGLGDFAGKIWRIGLMGESCTSRHVKKLMDVLNEVL